MFNITISPIENGVLTWTVHKDEALLTKGESTSIEKALCSILITVHNDQFDIIY